MIFNRILMKSNSDFFKLNEKEQTLYRLNFFNEADENSNIYDAIIGKEFFGKELKNDDFDNFSKEDYAKYNKIKCEFNGYGENNLIVTEFFMIDRYLADLPTVADYDLAFEKDQIVLEIENLKEQKNSEEKIKEFENKNYVFRLRTVWLRMIEEDVLHYVTLISGESHIQDLLFNFISNEVDKIYPNEIIKGESNTDSFLGNFGLKVDAKGKEDFLSELKTRSYKDLWKINENLYNEILSLNIDGVINQKEIIDGESHLTSIVINENTASKIKWESFSKDIQENEVEEKVLDELIERKKKEVLEMIKTNHIEIEKNFDPNKVVPIKKMQIIVTEQAMDDLSKSFKEDEDE